MTPSVSASAPISFKLLLAPKAWVRVKVGRCLSDVLNIILFINLIDLGLFKFRDLPFLCLFEAKSDALTINSAY